LGLRNAGSCVELERDMTWLYLLFAFAAGAMIPFQAGANARLAHWLHSPFRAAFANFLIGTIVLLAPAVAVIRPYPSAHRVAGAPWWVWVGELLGAFYVVGSVVTAPKLRAATSIALVVAG
jgi:bacterial/archaeal transporter family-2 protein